MIRTCLFAILAIAVANTTLAASSFDGTYRGTQRATLNNNSSDCANLNQEHMVVVVSDNKFVKHWGVATLPVDIAADGSFSASVVVSNRPLRQAKITGKITGSKLEADVGTDLCAGHLSLTR
jgi:hypothetical protein